MTKRITLCLQVIIVLFVFWDTTSYAELKKELTISGSLSEEMRQIYGQKDYLAWDLKLTIKNISNIPLSFGDDILLMEGDGKELFDGAYVTYSNDSPDKPENSDYLNKAHSYGLANFERRWSDGTMRGFRNGGTYSFAGPPEYKPEKTICNTTLAAGGTVKIEKTFKQGSYIHPHTRALLVLPSVKSGKSFYRIILTFKPSASVKGKWNLNAQKTIILSKAELLKLVQISGIDTAMTVLGLNWLTQTDTKAALPVLSSNIRTRKPGLPLVASLQLLADIDVDVDQETLNTIQAIASNSTAGDWLVSTANRYLTTKGLSVITQNKSKVERIEVKPSESSNKSAGEFNLNNQETKIYTNGEKYVGEIVDGKKNGQGTYTWSNGDTYIGAWKDDKRTGQGTVVLINGDKYVGGWEANRYHGQGTLTLANGDKYVGEWENGNKTGKGIYTTINGDKYVGDFFRGIFNGQGTYTWANGDEYIGEWGLHERHGQGSQTFANGEKYSGAWNLGKYHGQGIYIKANGEKYVGTWKNHQFYNGEHFDKDGIKIASYLNGSKQTEDIFTDILKSDLDALNRYIENGGDVNIKHKGNNMTLLVWAVLMRDESFVEPLVKAKADVNFNDGITALIAATTAQKTGVVKLLLRSGADVNAANVQGYTSLMLAAVTGNEEIVKLLLEAKANRALKDKSGKTALEWAGAKGHDNIAALLALKTKSQDVYQRIVAGQWAFTVISVVNEGKEIINRHARGQYIYRTNKFDEIFIRIKVELERLDNKPINDTFLFINLKLKDSTGNLYGLTAAGTNNEDYYFFNKGGRQSFIMPVQAKAKMDFVFSVPKSADIIELIWPDTAPLQINVN
ncbi:MAG: hypothetical protein EHM45_03045 [Desulfobacteraceae bacterium]|nr:MAG: hypothetical protein EHM45_03045 [Desulfobacteraceae bacterium]